MIGARYMKADMERAFLDAYFRYVRECDLISFDNEAFDGFVVLARGSGKAWFMDFSSKYEFPAEMKQATTNRKLTERAGYALEAGQQLGRMWEYAAVDVEYEVWCFMPPSERLFTALDAARANGAKVTLVTMDQVHDRMRQAVLAIPADKKDEDQAFVQAALMFRKAFGLQ